MFTRGVEFNTSVLVESTDGAISFDFRVNLCCRKVNEFSLSSNNTIDDFKFSLESNLVRNHIISKSGIGNFVS